MGKKFFFKAIAILLGTSIILSIVSCLFKIDTITNNILMVISAILIVIYFTHKNIRYKQTLLNNGRYDELIKYMINSHKLLKRMWGYKEQYSVSIASCYNRMGNFQESINYLEKIEKTKMDNNTKALYYAIYSLNLYFLNQSMNKAEELINKFRQVLDNPRSMLLEALIAIELDKKEYAKQLVEQKYKEVTRKKYIISFYTLIYTDEYCSEISENFMLGLYYKKMGEEEAAKRYFAKSANCNYKNYLSDISKEYILL